MYQTTRQGMMMDDRSASKGLRMGNCCTSGADKDSKRHPLLRSELASESSTAGAGVEAMRARSVVTVRSMESRARLDAIRGPPIFFVDKLPDSNEFTPSKKQNEVIRGSLKSGIKPSNVELPKGMSRITWLNIHIKDFNDHIRIFNKHVLVERCTRYSCSRMGERPNFFYTWQLDNQGAFSSTINKKLTAPDYIAKVIETNTVLLSRIAAMDQDDSCDEEKHEELCRTIVRLIFQVYCHILYWHHDAFVEMEALSHLNTCFKCEMKLLEMEDALPLQNLINRLFDMENRSLSDENAPSISLCPDESLYSDDVSKLTTPSFDVTDRDFSDDLSYDPAHPSRV